PLEDGRIFDVRAQEIRSTNGKYYGQIWYFRDITAMVTIEDKLQQQYQQISRANDEIAKLYERLKVENLRMSAELNVARHLQETILPKTRELQAIQSVDIAAFMEPANEVGGDYYDVFYVDRTAYITIGDITGHGLDSGIIMLMVQTTITTLIQVGLRPHEILTTLNAVLLKNLDRMGSDKSLTLAMLSVQEGKIRIIGQHEELLILRHNDRVERIDTNDLGFPIGLERDISPFLSYLETELMPGEVAILFTDGVTEAEDENGNFYGIDRLCEVALKYKRFSSQSICDKVVADIRQHMNDREVLDDITLIVIKQKCDYG
ncbi:MAG: ammonium transporter, partial [Cyanobacteria bacterium M5B4]